MALFRFLAVSLLLLGWPRLALADEPADFRKALADLQPGARYTPREYLRCTGPEEPCRHLEGAIGRVQVQVDLNDGTVSRFLVLAEGVRIERELLPTLHALYGTGETRREEIRSESVRPDQALRIAAAGSVTYEWRLSGMRIILFSQDPSLIRHDDGREDVTEPMKTYVSGELSP